MLPFLPLVVLATHLVGAPMPKSRFGPRSELPTPPVPIGAAAAGPVVQSDSTFEYSKAYYRRLDIHRWGSYAMVPLFAFQYAAGHQLFEKGGDAPAWARQGHPAAAAAISGLFVVNSVTGVWNLYEGWNDPTDRTRRRIHALLMLAADAGFVTTGMLAERAEGGAGDARDTHRTVAIGSMALATAGWVTMLDLFR